MTAKGRLAIPAGGMSVMVSPAPLVEIPSLIADDEGCP